MINQDDFKAYRRKCQMLPGFGFFCRELGDSELRVFMHACASSALYYKFRQWLLWAAKLANSQPGCC